MTLVARVLEIEQHALAAWPAAEVEVYEGWQLRAMSGVSRRANSVWTGVAVGSGSLERRIAYVESFYIARGLPPSFQVGQHSEPPGLDRALALRGYRIDAPVSVQIAEPSDVVRVAGSRSVRVEVTDHVTEAWFDVSGRQGRFAAVQDAYRGLLERLNGAARFALAFVEERPAGVGLAVDGGRLRGISSMFTLPAFRGRGVAQSVLRALASGAATDLCLYLQVENDNASALSLYARTGFVHHHAYHYRIARFPNQS